MSLQIRHNLTFYAQRGDVSVCGHSNRWNLEQNLPNFQLAIRSFQMPFYPSGPAPVLHEDKQGVLPYGIAFCVEPGVLNLQETFLKQVLLLISFSHPISCPQTPYASSSHEKDKHVSSHAAYEHPSAVYFQSEVPKRHGLCGEFAGLGKCIRSLVIFHHAFLSLEIRTVTRNGKLAERRTGCIFGFFSREVVRYLALLSVPNEQTAERTGQPVPLLILCQTFSPMTLTGGASSTFTGTASGEASE